MRSTVRVVRTLLGREAIVADWRYKKQPDSYEVLNEYSGIEACVRQATSDYTDEGYMSDGEWLDFVMELYDNGIAFL
jgi:hypothetical protein